MSLKRNYPFPLCICSNNQGFLFSVLVKKIGYFCIQKIMRRGFLVQLTQIAYDFNVAFFCY